MLKPGVDINAKFRAFIRFGPQGMRDCDFPLLLAVLPPPNRLMPIAHSGEIGELNERSEEGEYSTGRVRRPH